MGVAYNPRIVTDGLVACYDLGNTRRSYSPNAHPNPTNLYDWYVGIKGNNTANQSTISKDTIESPVGNTPLRMEVTGTDPYLQMYNNSIWNIVPASIGETWVVSVYVKASVNTTVQIFVFGANSSGGVFSPVDYSAITVNVTTEWTRVQHFRTFQNAATTHLHVRLDGPDTQGGGDATGQVIWWDGLQVERGSTPSNFTSDYTSGNVLDISANSNNGTIVSSPQYNNSNGGYVTFDGIDDYIGIGATAGDLGIYDGDYTFEAWVYPTDISALSGDNFIFGTTQTSLRQGLHLGFRNTGIYQGHYSSDYVSGTVTANQWYHLAWTYEKNLGATNGTAKIYKNGQLQPNPGTINSWIGDTEILIGNALTGSRHLQGRGALFKIYNRALTSKEVLQNFDAQKVRYGTLDPEPTIVKDGLILNLDTANKNSFIGYGDDWNDLSGNGNNGTLINGPIDPDNSGSIVFDGVDDHVSIPYNASLKPATAITMEAFCYIENNGGTWTSLIQYPVNSSSHTSPYFDWAIYLNKVDRLLHTRIDGEAVSSPNNVWNFNEWVYVAITFENQSVQYYVNGNNVGSSSVTKTSITYDANNPVYIGKNASGNEQFEGKLGTINVYNRALSATEIRQNYNVLRDRYVYQKPQIIKDDILLYLDAADPDSYRGSGVTWTDLSGNGYDGTLVNGVTFNSNYGGTLITDGSTQYIDIPIDLRFQDYTIITAVRYVTIGGRSVTAANNNWLMGHWSNSTVKYYAEGWVTDTDGSEESDVNWRIYAATGSQSSDSWALYVDGDLDTGPNNGGSAGPNGINIGRWGAGNGGAGSEFSNCEVSFLLCYDRILTEAEIKKNFNAFKRRFGI